VSRKLHMHQVSYRPGPTSSLGLVRVLLPEDATVLTAVAHNELHIRLWYYAFGLPDGDFAEARREFGVLNLQEYDRVPLSLDSKPLVWLAHVQLKAMHFHVFVPAILRQP